MNAASCWTGLTARPPTSNERLVDRLLREEVAGESADNQGNGGDDKREVEVRRSDSLAADQLVEQSSDRCGHTCDREPRDRGVCELDRLDQRRASLRADAESTPKKPPTSASPPATTYVTTDT